MQGKLIAEAREIVRRGGYISIERFDELINALRHEAEQGEGLREVAKLHNPGFCRIYRIGWKCAGMCNMCECLIPTKPTEPLAGIHISFSDRLRLEDEYLVWAKSNGVVVRPSSVITWAQSKGLLNTKAARAYLEGLADKEGV